MPPKVQIPKEKILQTALKLIISEGYEAVNIKRLAKELGCSTQPVSWTFGNMGNFRKELFEYALHYMNEKMKPGGKNPVAGFAVVGETYVNMAYDEPNLIRYLRMDTKGLVALGGIGAVFDENKNRYLKEALKEALNISEELVTGFITTVIVYTQGLVTLIIDKTVDYSREHAIHMLRNAGIIYMIYAGVPKEKAETFFKD